MAINLVGVSKMTRFKVSEPSSSQKKKNTLMESGSIIYLSIDISYNYFYHSKPNICNILPSFCAFCWDYCNYEGDSLVDYRRPL